MRGNTGHRDRHITRENLHEYEPAPEQPSAVPEPPDFITGYAAEVWRATAIELHRLRLLTKIDLTAFAVYCAAYAEWRRASNLIAVIDQKLAGYLTPIEIRKEIALRNTTRRSQCDAAAELLRFSIEFGLTPAARGRIRIGPGPKGPGKFDGLLGG